MADLIPTHRKAIWLDIMYAGAMTDEFENDLNNFVIGSGCYCCCELLANDTWNLINFTENEKIPPVTGETYYHGEFDFHLYGSATSKSPEGINNYCGTLYSNADINADQIISMEEIWDWTYNHDDGEFTGSILGLTINNNIIGNTTSLEYPTLLHTTYNANKTWRGLIGATKSFHVLTGKTLTFMDNSVVHLLNDADITVDAGSSLIIGNNVTFVSKSGTRKIIVNGDFQIGDNVNFLADEECEIRLEIDNNSLVKTFNSATFERGTLQSNQTALTLSNCNFNISGGVDFSYGTIAVSGCHFDQANVHVSNASSSLRQVIVNNQCTFDDYAGYALHIENYSIFNISNNTFTGNTSGIGIFWSGARGRSIIKNTITGGGNGIVVYNSSANITSNSLINNGNKIYNNYVGLRCLDNCNVSLTGYSGAKYAHETQVIQDNTYEEVLASEGSFPCPLRYNAIIDNDNNSGNPSYYLVKSLTTQEENFDVRYNYWSSGFNYLEDLYPSSCYTWDPVFSLNEIGGGGGEEDELLESAENKIEAGNYSDAKDDLQTLVEEYSSSVYAKTALKMLFSLEELAGNNYSSLKEYYLTHDDILTDSSLTKLSAFLANSCDIKLENWPAAIAWFENVIQDPPSFEDSIFAIIDLGYTYWLMENTNLKSAYTGTMVQYRFSNHNEFEENRDYLLSLLQGDKLCETMKQNISTLKPGELLQNVPNPFRETTQIWFKLKFESSVQIDIYNYAGQLMRRINDGIKTKGTHYIDFDATGLKNGIYFYSMNINGQTTDSKKMTILK